MTGAHARAHTAHMTVADFLDWDGGHQGKVELVDGAVRAQSPASVTHGRIQASLAFLIELHLRSDKRPCTVHTEPAVSPRLMAEHNLRVPDLGVTCSAVGPGQILMHEPVLLIEVLSPGNVNDTWDNVRAYATIPTVLEVLVVYSTRIRAEVFRRSADGSWPAQPEVAEAGGELRLASIGGTWPLAEVYVGTHLA